MSNATAKIVRFHETGGAEVLKIEELPLPEPAHGEVRLRVRAIGLNRAEIMFRRGQYFFEPELPSKLGYEASGIVEAVGPGVDAGLVGGKFSTVPAFPAHKYGVYGEVAIVPAAALAAYPERLSFEEGTSIWMQFLTAYGALVHFGRIGKGDFVLVNAASSSVGVAAIEIARVEGATSIAVTRTARKKAVLLELGADHVIVSNEENIAERVKAITGGKGARVIFDPVLGKGIEALAGAAAQGGTIFAYGALAPEVTPLPILAFLAKALSLRGYTLLEIVMDPELRGVAEKYVYDHLESGELKPKIARSFPLSQIVEAHRYMESNEQIGKIVVTV
jgi:NADPH:quinone reductase-like Zn-dependent oxidoreductase